MSAVHSVDLEDAAGLIAADRDGLLRAASTAGAQVRAIAAAHDEGELDLLRGGDRPRTVIWVGGLGPAETAGAMLVSTLAAAAAEPIALAREAPPWVGPLDVLIVAGDDPGDPALVAAAATGVRRGARVVVVAPYAGPLRDSTAGRVAVLEPRLRVPDEFGLCRYLAAGLAALSTVDPRLQIDLASLADELDAEALHNSAAREVFTNPAKTLAARVSGRRVALTGDNAATLALARHGSSVLLRIAQQVAAAAWLADAVVALRAGAASGAAGYSGDALFHDEQIDGPLPERMRVLALTLAGERTVVGARIAGLDDINLVTAEDATQDPGVAGSDGPLTAAAAQRPEQQLAILAVRLEMAAVYLRLARG
ncbi:TobH protein [Mycobacterium persicum]|uniref:TobH protein n=1 Tax=Mycobacterium persicum TaxID=1487726 RepID=UPI0007BE8A81|nr:TobH protein [Mycobacterium persicum]KZS83321.1 TobH protein [Mycobacterium persicum]